MNCPWALWTLTALGRDGTRVPDTTRQGKIRVLPLANPGWTLGSAHTLDGRRATYPRTNTPGAVTVSVQIVATTFPVDCRPLVLLSSDLISAKRPWPLLSCWFGGLYCDWFAATWWNWWRIRTLKLSTHHHYRCPCNLRHGSSGRHCLNRQIMYWLI